MRCSTIKLRQCDEDVEAVCAGGIPDITQCFGSEGSALRQAEAVYEGQVFDRSGAAEDESGIDAEATSALPTTNTNRFWTTRWSARTVYQDFHI